MDWHTIVALVLIVLFPFAFTFNRAKWWPEEEE